MRYLGFVLAFAVLLGALSGCSAAGPSAGASALRFGLLPILDVLPMYVAETEGFFKEQGLDVELILFASALERDSALQAGQIDGQLNDLISTALLNKDGDRAKAVRVAYRANDRLAMISVLAASNSKIKSPADLKGVPIAVSGNTIIEYSTDRMLRAAGLGAADIKTTEVTKIPVRVEMLVKDQIEAAALPEPMASLAVQQGARVVADDQKADISQSVVTFRQETIDKNSDTVRRFLIAYEKGVQTLSQKPDAYRDLMVEKAKVPDSLREKLSVPIYPPAGVSSRQEVADVVDWMVEKGMLAQKLSYERMVSGQLLPK